jgi:hypothetical protein
MQRLANIPARSFEILTFRSIPPQAGDPEASRPYHAAAADLATEVWWSRTEYSRTPQV